MVSSTTIRFGFKTSNNTAEYKVLLTGLRLLKEMQIERLVVNNDSKLAVTQVKGNFTTRDKSMVTHLKKVMDLLLSFEKFELIQIPKFKNVHFDALLKLANGKDSELAKVVTIEHLSKSFISKGEQIMWIEEKEPHLG